MIKSINRNSAAFFLYTPHRAYLFSSIEFLLLVNLVKTIFGPLTTIMVIKVEVGVDSTDGRFSSASAEILCLIWVFNKKKQNFLTVLNMFYQIKHILNLYMITLGLIHKQCIHTNPCLNCAYKHFTNKSRINQCFLTICWYSENVEQPQTMPTHKWWRLGCLRKCKHTPFN